MTPEVASRALLQYKQRQQTEMRRETDVGWALSGTRVAEIETSQRQAAAALRLVDSSQLSPALVKEPNTSSDDLKGTVDVRFKALPAPKRCAWLPNYYPSLTPFTA